MRRALVGLTMVVGLLAAPATASGSAIRMEGTVRWDVTWSIRWNDGESSRGFDLDAGKVADYDDLNLHFMCDGGPRSCEWYLAGEGFWKRASRPSYAACRDGWAADHLGQRYRPLADSASTNVPGYTWGAPDGTWLCALTETRFARVRILHWPTQDELWFRFRYRTWEQARR
jgi:hypothetical protein